MNGMGFSEADYADDATYNRIRRFREEIEPELRKFFEEIGFPVSEGPFSKTTLEPELQGIGSKTYIGIGEIGSFDMYVLEEGFSISFSDREGEVSLGPRGCVERLRRVKQLVLQVLDDPRMKRVDELMCPGTHDRYR